MVAFATSCYIQCLMLLLPHVFVNFNTLATWNCLWRCQWVETFFFKIRALPGISNPRLFECTMPRYHRTFWHPRGGQGPLDECVHDVSHLQLLVSRVMFQVLNFFDIHSFGSRVKQSDKISFFEMTHVQISCSEALATANSEKVESNTWKPLKNQSLAKKDSIIVRTAMGKLRGGMTYVSARYSGGLTPKVTTVAWFCKFVSFERIESWWRTFLWK